MLNVEKIEQNLCDAEAAIGENTIDAISVAIRALEKISSIDEKYEETASSLKNAYYELQEISRDISSYRDDVYFDDKERNEVEERLDLIYSLKRKYGNSINEIIEYNEQIKEEVYRIENLEEHNNKLKKEHLMVEEKMEKLASEIHFLRCQKGEQLSREINNNLQDLEMKNAKVNIHEEYAEEFYETGKDKVTIFIQPIKELI